MLQKASGVLAWIRNCEASRTGAGAVTILLYSGLRPQLECCVWMRELGFYSLEKRWLKGDLVTLEVPERRVQPVRAGLFSQITSDRK